MKRWAIAKLIDDGSGGLESAFNRYPCNTRIWTKPGFAWCIGQVAAADLVAMLADPDIHILPDSTLDMSVGNIPVGVRNAMKTKLEAAGFVYTNVKTSWTVRQLLNYLAQQVNPEINIEQGDIPDKTQ